MAKIKFTIIITASTVKKAQGRIPIAKPGHFFKDKKHYNRNIKHKKGLV